MNQRDKLISLLEKADMTSQATKTTPPDLSYDEMIRIIAEAPAADVESMQAQCKELKIALDRAMDEKSKIGVMYEELLKEKAVLEKRIEFYFGQIEAYRYCIDKRGN